MICVVLAAGYATRLYPLTENFPKPLLKVGEKTILDWLLDDIDAIEDVTEHVVISNHKFYDHFCQWSKHCALTKPVTVLDDGTESNETRLGAVRDMAFAIEQLSIDDDLLIIAGDNVIDFSFTKFVSYFHEKNASCIMRGFEQDVSVLQKCGVMEIDETDRVIRMVEKPKVPASNWAAPPFYLYKKEDVALVQKGIDAGCGVDAPGSFVAWLCEQSPVYAMEMPGTRYDIGDLEGYQAVQKEYRGIVR